MTNVRLRDLTSADLPWVAEREIEIFGASAWSLALLTEDFRFGMKRYRGVAVDDELAGYAIYGFDGDAFHLMNIAIVPGRRRKGLGRALLQDFLAEAAAVGAREAWLEVSVANPGAIALYVAHGFAEVRRRPRYYQPEDEDALVMRAFLEPRGYAPTG